MKSVNVSFFPCFSTDLHQRVPFSEPPRTCAMAYIHPFSTSAIAAGTNSAWPERSHTSRSHTGTWGCCHRAPRLAHQYGNRNFLAICSVRKQAPDLVTAPVIVGRTRRFGTRSQCRCCEIQQVRGDWRPRRLEFKSENLEFQLSLPALKSHRQVPRMQSPSLPSACMTTSRGLASRHSSRTSCPENG